MDLLEQNPFDLEDALRAAPSDWAPAPPASDRAAWEQTASALGEARVRELIEQAEAAVSQPVPALPATLWLEFARRGQREGYQQPRSARRQALARLALAECVEGRGRFLDPLLDIAWAICEESSWCLPAHQAPLTDMERPVIDLGSATTGLELAELTHLLGTALDPALAARVRYEVNRRLLVPYLTRHDCWWMFNSSRRSVNNWTAVCTAGVAGAACYVEEDSHRLAEVLHRAARSLHDYLATFDRDGGSTEGPGYWSYGFGYYTLIGQLVEARTGGAARWMDPSIVRLAAQFPLRTIMSPGRYVNFSDCDPVVRLIPAQLVYLARRLDLPDLETLATRQPSGGREELPWALRNLVWRPAPDAAQQALVPAAEDFFRDMHWLIARATPEDPAGLVLAAKGGHNAEMHNQNDVGNVIVHLHGESVVADIGRGRYTRDYFGPRRYEHLANSSLGHSVPVANGQAQVAGREHAARLLDRQADETTSGMTLDLKDAYPPEARLAQLQRSVALHRSGAAPAAPTAGDSSAESSGAWVSIEDRVRFDGPPGTLESVLTTYGDAIAEGNGSVLLRGERAALRVTSAPAQVAARIEVVPDVDMADGPRTVTRVCFALTHPAAEGTIRLEIRPAGV